MFGFDIAEITETLERLVKLQGDKQRRNLIEAEFLRVAMQHHKNGDIKSNEVAQIVDSCVNAYFEDLGIA